MENESLFHDTTRSGVEWDKLEFSIIQLNVRLLCILYVEYAVAIIHANLNNPRILRLEKYLS